MTLQELIVLLAATALAGVLGLYFRREAARRQASRRALTARADEVIDDLTRFELASGYQKLMGTWRGLPVIIEPIVDTLAIRKLPVLWLSITIPAPLPVRARFDLMMRPTGSEIFSRFRDLPVSVTTPADFPPEAHIRTDDPAHLPPADIIARHLAPFRSGKAKELLVMPQGLRMVWMIDEAARGHYLLFRDADFRNLTIDAADWNDMLAPLAGLRADLIARETKAP